MYALTHRRHTPLYIQLNTGYNVTVTSTVSGKHYINLKNKLYIRHISYEDSILYIR
ncbi:hypothetical protein CI610_02534 [invertebrate metagenome]|uniref:Uncharacterized protein n=1 Tax=invertebrate metagenome TaxID=1711999 RepID=A0A2H9T5M9_9ZZZZ